MADPSHEPLLRDYYAAWTSDTRARVTDFFREDAIFEDLAFEARFEGVEQIRSFVELTYAGIPDFVVVPTYIVAGEAGAAAQWTMSGTHAADLPGFPATGKSFEVRASSVVEIAGGKIQRITDYWSPDSFRRSVGIL